jgi:hypothetical protein
MKNKHTGSSFDSFLKETSKDISNTDILLYDTQNDQLVILKDDKQGNSFLISGDFSVQLNDCPFCVAEATGLEFIDFEFEDNNEKKRSSKSYKRRS